MTNLEQLTRPEGEYDLGEILCSLISDLADCERCPFTNLCAPGKPGASVWLKQESNPEGLEKDLEPHEPARSQDNDDNDRPMPWE